MIDVYNLVYSFIDLFYFGRCIRKETTRIEMKRCGKKKAKKETKPRFGRTRAIDGQNDRDPRADFRIKSFLNVTRSPGTEPKTVSEQPTPRERGDCKKHGKNCTAY